MRTVGGCCANAADSRPDTNASKPRNGKSARGITPDSLDIVFPLLRLSTITNTTPPSAPYSAASGSAVGLVLPWRELTEHFSGMCKIGLDQRAKLRRDLRTLTEPEFKPRTA